MKRKSKNSPSHSKLHIFLAYCLCLVGLLIFAKGFFPIKASSRRSSSVLDLPLPPNDQDTLIQLIKEDFSQKNLAHPSDKISGSIMGPFKKLVLMVVDAMRIDFVQSTSHWEHMPFLQSVIQQKQGKVYTAKAKAPTVTMPRLKAMATGSIPGYIDVVLNMDQSMELKENNLIEGLVNKGSKIVFYGDDTWMRLFPNSFHRTDGTNSFFVTDYTEVDNNVTRHLSDELHSKSDWNVMILHYLGLDHIGHIAGPSSPLVAPKLKEMDNVIETIYSALKNEKETLFVVTSDHGMSARGSHGGTTEPEVDTPLIFISPEMVKNKDEHGKVEQIDLAATLAVMMGIPIPVSSMGRVIPGMLSVLNESMQLHSMQYNCHQLLSHVAHSGRLSSYFSNPKSDPLHLYRNGLQFHSKYLTSTEAATFTAAIQNYKKSQIAASDILTSNLASYNYPEMGIGITILYAGFCLVLYLWVDGLLLTRRTISADQRSKKFTRAVIALVVGSLVHVVTLASSSFVEEEHQIWYFLSSSVCIVLTVAVLRAAAEAASTDSKKGVSSSLYDAQANIQPELRLRRGGKAWQVVSDVNKPVERQEETNGDVSAEIEEELSHFKDHPIAKNKHRRVIVAAFVLVIFHRVLRSWNQTGIQYADLHDIGDWLNLPDHKLFLSFASSLSLLLVLVMCEMICSTRDVVRTSLSGLGLITVYMYRCATDVVFSFVPFASHNQTIGISEARIVYLLAAVLVTKAVVHRISEYFCNSVKPKKTHRCSTPTLYCSPTPTSRQQALDSLLSALILISALLLRPHNHSALALNLVVYWCLYRVVWPVAVEGRKEFLDCELMELRDISQLGGLSSSEAVVRIAVASWFGQMAYFTLGNSNSFATVDLSAAYVGLSGSEGWINSICIILLGSLTTYIGPILWITLCVFDLIKLCAPDEADSFIKKPPSTSCLVACTIITMRLLQLTVYVAVATGHRYHLFVWSVFSPKLLYELVATSVYGCLLVVTLLLW